jgi:hypothetical protein
MALFGKGALTDVLLVVCASYTIYVAEMRLRANRIRVGPIPRNPIFRTDFELF